MFFLLKYKYESYLSSHSCLSSIKNKQGYTVILIPSYSFDLMCVWMAVTQEATEVKLQREHVEVSRLTWGQRCLVLFWSLLWQSNEEKIEFSLPVLRHTHTASVILFKPLISVSADWLYCPLVSVCVFLPVQQRGSPCRCVWAGCSIAPKWQGLSSVLLVLRTRRPDLWRQTQPDKAGIYFN